MRANIENGTINAHSIRIRPYAVETVCLENDCCFYDVLGCDLLEVSYVTVNAVVGTNFEVLSTSYSETGEIKYRTEQNGTLQQYPFMITTSANGDWIPTVTTTTDIPYWTNGTGTGVEYEVELDDNIKVTQIIDDDVDKVKTMEDETPEPSATEEDVAGEDLSSTDNSEELLAKLNKVLDIQKALEAEQEKLKEQNLDLSVKKTMTLFEGVENKADIEKHITVVAENGGEDALTAMKEILKSVMESTVIVDEKLTQMGGEDKTNSLDELSKRDFGGTVTEVVNQIVKDSEHNIDELRGK
jgi:hypothetical protein